MKILHGRLTTLLLLAAVSLVSGLAITRRNGIVWGLCGFIAVSLAPAAGLAPELPGMPAGDLAAGVPPPKGNLPAQPTVPHCDKK